MALNVPMQTVQQPIVQSLSDAVAKWTDINNAQQQGQLATQKMDMLKSQTERENKVGDLKFATDKQSALKSVMTDVKSKMDDFTQKTGFAEGSPEFQQRLNAVYSTTADPIVQNITGTPYKQGTNVEWQHVNSLAGMTPAETQANEMQLQTAKQDAILRNQMQLGQFNNEYKDRADQRDFEQSVGLEDRRYGHDLEKAQLENKWKLDTKMETEQAKQQAAQEKPLPATIVKEQQKLRDQIDTASQMNKMLSTFEKQLDDGKLNLSLTGNLANKARNYLGASTDESTALASFQSGMEKMRNDSLRLNSGVQTEGDATRAWNELFANINDEKVVKQRLAEIRGYNESAINFKKADINAMRSEYGKGEFDDSAYTQKQQAATPQEIPPKPPHATQEEWDSFLIKKGLK